MCHLNILDLILRGTSTTPLSTRSVELRYYRSNRLASQEQNSCSERAQSGIFDNFRSSATVNDVKQNSANTGSTDLVDNGVVDVPGNTM
jgi:hypothetical protein